VTALIKGIKVEASTAAAMLRAREARLLRIKKIHETGAEIERGIATVTGIVIVPTIGIGRETGTGTGTGTEIEIEIDQRIEIGGTRTAAGETRRERRIGTENGKKRKRKRGKGKRRGKEKETRRRKESARGAIETVKESAGIRCLHSVAWNRCRWRESS
jgi:hypothetical protein